MAESDALNLRISLMSRHGLIVGIVGVAIFVGIAALSFPTAISETGQVRWPAFCFAVLPSLLAAAGFAVVVARFARKALVLDRDGIWLEGRQRRGLLWKEVTGYELPDGPGAPALRVFGLAGKAFAIPRGWASDFDSYRGDLLRELDRRVGLDGTRPVLAVAAGESSRRLLHPDRATPAVELEPNLRYRYIQPEVLAGELRSRIGVITALLVGAGILSLSILKDRDVLSAIFGAVLVVVGSILIWGIGIDLRLLRSLQDRFIRRGERLYVLRKGLEIPLPPAKADSGRFLGRQPTTVHGRGPFPYRIAPQLLEPDV